MNPEFEDLSEGRQEELVRLSRKVRKMKRYPETRFEHIQLTINQILQASPFLIRLQNNENPYHELMGTSVLNLTYVQAVDTHLKRITPAMKFVESFKGIYNVIIMLYKSMICIKTLQFFREIS